jgi:hypothetical protein
MRRKNLKRQADSTYAEIVLTDKDACSYDSTKCLKELQSADDILDRVRVDRSLIFKSIRKMTPCENFHPFEKILPIDEKCMCQGGWGLRPYVNKQFCVGCEIIRRISKGIKIPEDSILTIEYGSYTSHTYSIVSCENIFLPYERSKEYEVLSHILLSKLQSMNIYNPIFKEINDRTFYYSTISPIVNYINICIILQNKLHKHKFPTVPLFEWAYQCGKNTYLLEIFPNMGFGTLENIIENPDYVRGPKSPTARRSHAMTINSNLLISILKQLISTLHFLSNYSYIHGNPNIRHLAFTKKPCYYKYDDVEISAPITLHLIPSNDSSITIENDNGEFYRFLNSGYIKTIKEYDHILEKVEPFLGNKLIYEDEIKTKSIIPVLPDLENNLIYGYKIGVCKSVFKDLLTQKGIPLVNTSFDFYMFMFSLLSEESFYLSFSEHPELMNLWKDMFKFSEYEDMMNDLKNLRVLESPESISFQEIYDVMSKYTFRCDAIQYFWECLKKIV